MAVQSVANRATRQISILLTLSKLNSHNVFPGANELIREDDGRDVVTIGTLCNRRKMLAQLTRTGMVVKTVVEGRFWPVHSITDEGIMELRRLGYRA